MRSLISIGTLMTILLASEVPEASPCRTPTPTARPTSASVAGGGVVVMQILNLEDLPGSSGTERQDAWRFRAGAAKTTPRIESLAPGLAVYRPTAAAETLELVDGNDRTIATLTSATSQGALAAPKVSSITHVTRHGRRGSAVIVDVHTPDGIPADVVAIVLSDAKGPLTWGAVKKGWSQSSVYLDGGCTYHPAGTCAPRIGTTLKVTYVDAGGRVSAPAQAKVVAQAPPP